MAEQISYHLKGVVLCGCSCNWGCPCNFQAPPTQGFCEGGYFWHVQEGTYGAVALHGLNFAWCAHSPGPIHLGNLTSLYLVDEQATPAQRQAIEALLTTNPTVMPFSIFKALTSTMLGVRYVPFVLDLQGTQSRVKVGDIVDLQLAPMKNPVTGEEEPATLLKPKGFTSQQQELCATLTFRLTTVGSTASSPFLSTKAPDLSHTAGQEESVHSIPGRGAGGPSRRLGKQGQAVPRSGSWPNNRLQATADSLRSCLAPAIGGA